MIKYALGQTLFSYVLLWNPTKICKFARISLDFVWVMDLRLIFAEVKPIKLFEFTRRSSMCNIRLIESSDCFITLSLLLLLYGDFFLILVGCILTWINFYVLLCQNLVTVLFKIQKSRWSYVWLVVRDDEGISVFPTRIVLNNYS